AHRPERLVGDVRRHDSQGDIRLQHRVQYLEEAIERPLALRVESIDELCPAEVLPYGPIVGGSGSVIASGFTDEIVSHSSPVSGIVVAEGDDAGRSVVLSPGRDEESVAALLSFHRLVFSLVHHISPPKSITLTAVLVASRE